MFCESGKRFSSFPGTAQMKAIEIFRVLTSASLLRIAYVSFSVIVGIFSPLSWEKSVLPAVRCWRSPQIKHRAKGQRWKMKRDFWLKTDRIGFSEWRPEDIGLAELLWGDPNVTRWICASGQFSKEDIALRLREEIDRNREFHVQYWPIFELATHALLGCCGLRPYKSNCNYEIGFHLRPKFWGQGFATEAAAAVAHDAFHPLHAESLFAGHNPNNTASKNVLMKLGFCYVGEAFYPPTGLYHPSYELKRKTE